MKPYSAKETDADMLLAPFLHRPIAFHRSFVAPCGGILPALLLSQALYWSGRTTDQEGWFFKTQAEWAEETALTRYEQESAREKLRTRGILEEKRQGVPARLYYRVNKIRFCEVLYSQARPTFADKDAAKPHAGVGRRSKQDRAAVPNITESTSESTSESTESSTSDLHDSAATFHQATRFFHGTMAQCLEPFHGIVLARPLQDAYIRALESWYSRGIEVPEQVIRDAVADAVAYWKRERKTGRCRSAEPILMRLTEAVNPMEKGDENNSTTPSEQGRDRSTRGPGRSAKVARWIADADEFS